MGVAKFYGSAQILWEWPNFYGSGQILWECPNFMGVPRRGAGKKLHTFRIGPAEPTQKTTYFPDRTRRADTKTT